MSEKFLENFKKYSIIILVYALLTFLFSYIEPEKLYWHRDISENKDFINELKIYIGIAVILIFIVIFKIYKEVKKEKYNGKKDERRAYIFTASIASVFIILWLTYILNGLIIDSRLFINKQFEKETETNKYKIDLLKNNFVDIKKLNGGYERIDIDSLKYKNIHLKDSIAVVKSKIGLFKIPYDHEIVEIK